MHIQHSPTPHPPETTNPNHMNDIRIVVLDGHCLNPGDLTWDPFRQLGRLAVHDRTAPAQLLERAQGAEALLTNKTRLAAADLEALPRLKYVGVLATGYNVVDVRAASRLGVTVTNIPAYGTDSVAQTVFAHILNLTQRVDHYARAVRQGRWSAQPDFCYFDTPLAELSGKTMGIVGLGRIGAATARIALAFGMRVLASTSKPPQALPPGVEKAALDDVFRRADIVSLHCPLTPATERLADAARLALMKPGAILVNTGRGPLVDEQALADALNEGRLAAAALDVLGDEPPPAGHPLLRARNCQVTPHIAWATREARARLMAQAADNLRAYLAGRPVNQVNP